jgi:hypothetical protein
MERDRYQRAVRAPMRLFASLLAIPGAFVGTICLLRFVDHPTFQLAEWAVLSLATAVFFGLIAIRGRQV